MATTTTRLSVEIDAERVHTAPPTGTLEVHRSSEYQKLMRVRNGDSVVLDYIITASTTVLELQVPPQALLFPDRHRDYLSTAISRLNLGPEDHEDVTQCIVSTALNQAAGPSGFTGYSMVVDLKFRQIDEVDERLHTFETMLMEEMDLAPKGAPRSAIYRLIKNGSFVASKTDEDLGTCSICLEDFSSSAGADQALLRMDCSHVYHQSCILPWLAKSNTCPTCRDKVD
ncbi:hypothetical protein CJ030_MR3G009349 [Morella rubra]|uniref:RING-type domain-containing protein n=1 Tax=Morella rubra TaxID=262757 RepID=A0A6A1W668_9ROSI|nr:hypothetical protein CJ030_MR3G009349 [Morella rubra]